MKKIYYTVIFIIINMFFIINIIKNYNIFLSIIPFIIIAIIVNLIIYKIYKNFKTKKPPK
jgi:hypothetical protein